MEVNKQIFIFLQFFLCFLTFRYTQKSINPLARITRDLILFDHKSPK